MREPLKGYSNDRFLITAEALLERLEDSDIVLVDSRPLEDYQAGHLPDACHIDLFELRLTDSSDAACASFHHTMERVLAEVGVTPGSTVVFYDEVSGMRSSRGVFLMEYFGFPEASLLDGGLTAWQSAGGPMSDEVPEPSRGTFTARLVGDLLATCGDIIGGLGRDDVVLLDARRPSEYSGEEVRTARGGHIPGAVNVEWTENLDPNGAFKPADALRAIYATRGVVPEKEIITYCQGGYRSSNAWLALKLIGYPRVRNYLSSWAEWGNRDDTPIACPASP